MQLIVCRTDINTSEVLHFGRSATTSTMHRWYAVLVCAVVVIVGAVDLASAAAVVKEHQVTAGRDTPLAWPSCLTEGRLRREAGNNNQTAVSDNAGTTAESGDEDFEYAVIVDAGSSGSRLRVYRWRKPAGGARVAVQTPSVRQIHTKKLKPGLSAHASNLEKVTDDIRSLMSEATEHVPESSQSSSPVYVMATAGESIQCLTITGCGGEPLTPSRLFGIIIVYYATGGSTYRYIHYNIH